MSSVRHYSVFVAFLALLVAALVVMPATALGQGTGLTPTPGASATTVASPTPVPAAAITTSTSKAAPGTSITVNGTGFQSGETVDVTFNGQPVGEPTASTDGNWALTFTLPNVAPGDYGIAATGRGSNRSASRTFTIELGAAAVTFSSNQALPGAAITINGTGFQPGETVDVTFNGPSVGTVPADTSGNFAFPFTIPQLAPGTFGVTVMGQTSNREANATFTVLAGPTPVATAVPTAGPAPAATATPAPAPAPNPGTAPAMQHDDRYFSQTGYRIDNDQVWAFFQQYGGVSAFGYPTSRMITFLGCPVQFFQRQIIQVCGGQGAALINMLDPEIFPYTRVNGSVFPAPDDALKANTPPVSDPQYSEKITQFVEANVPDTWNGQQVGFLQTFNSLGGLTIWGAPISQPAPDPSNPNFIYQRFQRGIMHFIAGTGTESVLLADYLKAILMNQNVPSDLMAQSGESRYFNQYCPGQTMWLCRPADLPGTDLTNGFVQG